MKLHKEGYKIIFYSLLIIVVIEALFFWFLNNEMLKYTFLFSGILLFFFICRFFRVPKRVPVTADESIISPADGTVVIIKEVYEGEYLKKNCMQVSIFMSVFNVHINWFPVSGVVEYYKYHPGRYLVAFHPKSSEKNERTSIAVNNGKSTILFRQIAGLLARRIVCYAQEGDYVKQSEEVGFIKFGSRLDLFLPIDSKIEVTRGEKVTGSKTIIAKLP